MSEIHPLSGQPIGLEVDSRPADRPGAVTLTGRYAAVERLQPSRHGISLWEAVRDHDSLWTYMAYGPFPDEGAFSGWLSAR
jgi:hypothetical protein